MTETQEKYLVKSEPRPIMAWQELREIAEIFHKSGLAPQHFKSAEQVVSACVVARDLNLPVSTVLTGGLYVVNGVVSTDSKTMMALIMRARGEIQVNIEKDDAEGWVRVTMERPSVGLSYTATWDEPRVRESRVNMQPGKNEEKWPWRLHRQTMKTWRAVAEAARVVAPDLIGGLYLADEVDVPTKVQDGEMVIDAEVTEIGQAISDETITREVADRNSIQVPDKPHNMNELYTMVEAQFEKEKDEAVQFIKEKTGCPKVVDAMRNGWTVADFWTLFQNPDMEVDMPPSLSE